MTLQHAPFLNTSPPTAQPVAHLTTAFGIGGRAALMLAVRARLFVGHAAPLVGFGGETALFGLGRLVSAPAFFALALGTRARTLRLPPDSHPENAQV